MLHLPPDIATRREADPLIDDIYRADVGDLIRQAGGEVMTVTDITGRLGDRFDRVAVGGWGTATIGQVWTTTGGSASDYSVQGG
ncbi:hypothetical protein [Streptomyces sp. NPDC002785]|uniref:hypothetical protein n=1 Tax=Streptomyces sp. NPDC002785 TaxID=3154543 RepID=UPI0033322787